MISIGLIIYLQLEQPFESKFDTWVETSNECVTLAAMYFLMCFTDFVPLAEDRDMLGSYYIALILTFVSIHVLILLSGVFISLKLSLKKRKQKKEMKKRKKQAVSQERQVNEPTLMPLERLGELS